MLLFAALFQCLDPALTVAAAAAARSPFLTPMEPGARRAADAQRKAFADAAGGGSDHLACVAAYAAWEAARGRGGGAERQLCAAGHLSPGALTMLQGLRGQLAGALQQLGIAPGHSAGASDNARAAPGLVRAVLGAGMYPLVGLVAAAGGERERGPPGRVTLATLRGEKVRVHPASVNGGRGEEAPPATAGPPTILAFEELVRGDVGISVRDTTAVPPHVLLLVAARLGVEPDLVSAPPEEGQEEEVGPPVASAETAILVVDDWLRLRVPLPAVAWVCTLRLRLAAAFAARVQRPHAPLTPALAAAVHAAAAMLAAETGGTLPPQGGGAGGGGMGGRGRGGAGARGGPPPGSGPGRGAARGPGGPPPAPRPAVTRVAPAVLPPPRRPPPPPPQPLGPGGARQGKHTRFAE